MFSCVWVSARSVRGPTELGSQRRAVLDEEANIHTPKIILEIKKELVVLLRDL